MFNYIRTAFIPEGVKTEIAHLIRSFLGAVAVGAALAALQWLGANIPHAVQLLTMVGGGYAGIKMGKPNV